LWGRAGISKSREWDGGGSEEACWERRGMKIEERDA
jgi:hypothetical protein